jgi:hypothetical protein
MLSVKLDLTELQTLLELSETELFREKFINPKYPGHRVDPERLGLATSATRSLREVFHTAKGFPIKTTA